MQTELTKEQIKITRKQICDVARTLLGTPYHHQGRLKGVGLDCAGVAVAISQELGIFTPEQDYSGYSNIPDGRQLLLHCRKNCKEKPANEYKAGDILLFRFDKDPQHIGVMLEDNYFIHSYMRAGKVVMHTMSEEWIKRIVGVFEFPQLLD